MLRRQISPRGAQPAITARDVWGRLWIVREERVVAGCPPILLGWIDRPAHTGRIAIATIPTPEFCGYLREHARENLDSLAARAILGRNAIKRLRAELGISRAKLAREWWGDRLEDLALLSGTEFARRHGVSIAAVSAQHRAFFGRRIRAAGWWRAPDVGAILLDPVMSRREKARLLEIGLGSVGVLAWRLRAEGNCLISRAELAARLRAMRAGKPALPQVRAALAEAARRPKSRAHRISLSISNRATAGRKASIPAIISVLGAMGFPERAAELRARLATLNDLSQQAALACRYYADACSDASTQDERN